jgi:hypothetical protein
MKYWVLFFAVFAPLSVFSQIPNAGFEEWSDVNGELIPEGWEVECCTGYVTRDTDHVQGDYSIRLFGDLYGIDVPAATWIEAKVNYSTPPNKLKFFCKCLLEEAVTTGFCGLRVSRHGYGAVFWYDEEGIDEFKEITVDLDTLELQQDGNFHIDFYASLGWGWPPLGSATLLIDSVSLEYTTNLSLPEPDFFVISPNPFNQFIRVNGGTNLSVERLILRDMVGRVISEAHTNLLTTNNLLPGQYYLTVIDEKGGIKTKLVIKSQ